MTELWDESHIVFFMLLIFFLNVKCFFCDKTAMRLEVHHRSVCHHDINLYCLFPGVIYLWSRHAICFYFLTYSIGTFLLLRNLYYCQGFDLDHNAMQHRHQCYHLVRGLSVYQWNFIITSGILLVLKSINNNNNNIRLWLDI